MGLVRGLGEGDADRRRRLAGGRDGENAPTDMDGEGLSEALWLCGSVALQRMSASSRPQAVVPGFPEPGRELAQRRCTWAVPLLVTRKSCHNTWCTDGNNLSTVGGTCLQTRSSVRYIHTCATVPPPRPWIGKTRFRPAARRAVLMTTWPISEALLFFPVRVWPSTMINEPISSPTHLVHVSWAIPSACVWPRLAPPASPSSIPAFAPVSLSVPGKFRRSLFRSGVKIHISPSINFFFAMSIPGEAKFPSHCWSFVVWSQQEK